MAVLVFLTISVFGSIIISTNSQPTFLYHSCSHISSDNDANFKTNLPSVLDHLSSQATANSFYRYHSNGIYSQFLCRGDIKTSTCQSCVSQASQEIITRCESNKTAIIWYDTCLFRYSNDSFYGKRETSPTVFMFNVKNSTSPDQSDIDALALMYPLIKDASNTDILYKTGELLRGNGFEYVYGLVQCTRDINGSSCSSCLGELMNQAQVCCQRKVGWRILAPSCNLRFESYMFYEGPLTPPALPPDASPSGRKEGGNNSTIIILSIVIPFAIIATLLAFVCCFYLRRKRRITREREMSEEILLQSLGSVDGTQLAEQGIGVRDQDNSGEMQYFSLSTILAATNNFSDENKLGEGGFGPVYKGKLIDGKEVAIKRLSVQSKQGLVEFKNEVMLLVKLQHKNLVRLLGCCMKGDEKILVYEYMANTSLDAILFDPTKRSELDWSKRANIINGIARGILYLHEDSRLKIIHRDLKASNVLLDDEMNPKISDFGTARIFGGKQLEANTDRVVGTYGYMAPEYALEGLISVKSDVYSFGVLMLEIITGKKNSGFYHPDRTQNLLSHAWRLWSEGKGVELVDPDLINACPKEEAMRWVNIGLLCIQEDPNNRPTMSTVVLMLGSIGTTLPQPFAPPFSTGRFFENNQTSTTTGDVRGYMTLDISTTTASY